MDTVSTSFHKGQQNQIEIKKILLSLGWCCCSPIPVASVVQVSLSKEEDGQLVEWFMSQVDTTVTVIRAI
jgi:hypothetical protein